MHRFSEPRRGLPANNHEVAHPPPDIRLPGMGYRLALLFALTVIPFWEVFRGIAISIAGGSLSSCYLVVVPFLAGLITLGYRTPPSGVGDPESDWILAAIFGGLGLFLRHLMSIRFPTLSGLWQLPLVGAVLWAASLAAVLFGVRRVTQLWTLWIFAVVTATPLPALMITAALGGGLAAALTVTAIIGGAAVTLASPQTPVVWRIAVSAATTGLGFAVASAAPFIGAQTVGANLALTVLIGAMIPTAGALALRTLAAPATTSGTPLPRRTRWSMVVLVAAAVEVFILNQPFGTIPGRPPLAQADWPARMGLAACQHFPFIQRYLGPQATFRRYCLTPPAEGPNAAVDVISTDNLASLRVLRDAVWYPATAAPNFRPADLGSEVITDGRVGATDAALTTAADGQDWYVVTWTWRTPEDYQQVFVVVNQNWSSQSPPAAPAVLSWRATVLGPALWLARQQADPSNQFDASVVRNAQRIVTDVLGAARPQRE